MSCSDNGSSRNNKSNEDIFYSKLDSLKLEFADKPVRINKKKFNESTDPITPIYLYTNTDKDNLAGKVLFADQAIHKLSIVQISSIEYPKNFFDKNLMVQVEAIDGRYSGQDGWISIEHIEEFNALAPFIDKLK